MVDGVVMCEKDYAELVATWPCLGCGKEIPTGDPALAFITFSRSLPYFLLTTSFPDISDHVCCCFLVDLDKNIVYWYIEY